MVLLLLLHIAFCAHSSFRSEQDAKYGNEPFVLPFPHLMKGDIAFFLRLEAAPCLDVTKGKPPLAMVCQDWAELVSKRRRLQVHDGRQIGASVMVQEGANIFVNLETVNYILHGIQHYRDSEPGWRDSFWRGFGLHRLDPLVQNNAELLCAHVVRCCMAPFGVVVSETTHSSDQAVAMVVDGRVERMRNYWAKQGAEDEEIEMPQPGDELVFVLERREMRLGIEHLEEELETWAHVLPSFLAGYDAVKMVFPIQRPVLPAGLAGPVERKHWIWQLVPAIKSMHSNSACWEGRGFFTLGRVY